MITFLLAISWPPEDGRSHHARDFYDFRASSWFVEAATSPKDLVILLDTSSAAGGHRGALARATASGILDALGPNDFVNIFTFSDVTEELVPCFKNMLVQVSLFSLTTILNIYSKVSLRTIVIALCEGKF